VLGFVVGLAAEARIAARCGNPVRTGGGTPDGADAAARHLVGQGVTALVSFGLAGGLDPALRPGTLIIPSVVLSNGDTLSADASLADRFGGFTGHTILAGSVVAATGSAKRRLFAATQANAIDLESGAVAQIARARELPFVVVRAICDPADRDLPPAALIALDTDGGVGVAAVLRSVLGRPGQISGLLALARDAALARRALIRAAERFQAAESRSNR
jgi:adenosylhomocysteine nucleosidase